LKNQTFVHFPVCSSDIIIKTFVNVCLSFEHSFLTPKTHLKPLSFKKKKYICDQFEQVGYIV